MFMAKPIFLVIYQNLSLESKSASHCYIITYQKCPKRDSHLANKPDNNIFENRTYNVYNPKVLFIILDG